MEVLLGLVIFLAVFHLLYFYLSQKVSRDPQAVPFDGDLYRIGDHYVAVKQQCDSPAQTVICFPGFLEDMRYFLEVYADKPVELILINNGNYHCPFTTTELKPLTGKEQNPYPSGTIAYDAFCLNQVRRALATCPNLIVHGHSRGGAVVLEAGKQAPEMAGQCHAILEAPVVPGGRLVSATEKRLGRLGFYLLPFVFTILRSLPTSFLLKSPLMKISTPYKAKIFLQLPWTPRQLSTAIVNVKDIIDWQKHNSTELYANYGACTMYVGEVDGVLSRRAMLASGRQCPRLEIVETQGTDHFISLEQPQLIQLPAPRPQGAIAPN